MEEVQQFEEPVAKYGKLYTYADYLAWEFDRRVEILRGKLFWMSPAPSTSHQKTSGLLTRKFYSYFHEKHSCSVFVAPFDVRLPNRKTKSEKDEQVNTVFQPDLCVVCDSHKIDRRGCLGAPNLIIEILSPGNSKTELNYKFDIYEEAGVLEYWMVNYSEQVIFQYFAEGGRLISHRPKTVDDEIESIIFSELRFAVADIFEGVNAHL